MEKKFSGSENFASGRTCARCNARFPFHSTHPLSVLIVTPTFCFIYCCRYISADFVNHPTSDLALSLLKKHNIEHFEVYIFATTPDDGSPYRKQIQEKAHCFVDLPRDWSDSRCADAVAKCRLDVLIDFNGHTCGERLAIQALRPAPVQVRLLPALFS